jgi:hypothetical protein
MKRITVSIPNELAEKIDVERRKRDVSAATVIREAVAAYYAEPSLNDESDVNDYPFIGLFGEGLEPSDYASHDEEVIARHYSNWITDHRGPTESGAKDQETTEDLTAIREVEAHAGHH